MGKNCSKQQTCGCSITSVQQYLNARLNLNCASFLNTIVTSVGGNIKSCVSVGTLKTLLQASFVRPSQGPEEKGLIGDCEHSTLNGNEFYSLTGKKLNYVRLSQSH